MRDISTAFQKTINQFLMTTLISHLNTPLSHDCQLTCFKYQLPWQHNHSQDYCWQQHKFPLRGKCASFTHQPLASGYRTIACVFWSLSPPCVGQQLLTTGSEIDAWCLVSSPGQGLWEMMDVICPGWLNVCESNENVISHLKECWHLTQKFDGYFVLRRSNYHEPEKNQPAVHAW